MLIIVATLQAKPDKKKEMEEALRNIVPKVQAEEGTLAYVLHRSSMDDGKFLFYEKYINKEALDFHSSTPYFKELFGIIGPLLATDPSIEIYEELESAK